MGGWGREKRRKRGNLSLYEVIEAPTVLRVNTELKSNASLSETWAKTALA